MPTLSTHGAARTVAVPVDFFAALQEAVSQAGAPLAVDAVRDAGYRAGQALFETFAEWLDERGEADPASLAHDRFMPLAGEFFTATGWGEIAFTPLSDAVMAIDAASWGEAAGAGGGCLVSTGLFAGFFGRLADAPIAVLEVECSTPGGCRFLLGSVDVLGYVHEAMERGIPYERAAASA